MLSEMTLLSKKKKKSQVIKLQFQLHEKNIFCIEKKTRKKYTNTVMVFISGGEIMDNFTSFYTFHFSNGLHGTF